MALDSNLFTLSFQRRTGNPTVLDLIPFAPSSTLASSSSSSSSSSSGPSPLYSFLRARSAHYSVRLTDSLTDIVLASINCPYSNDKSKSIQLYNPNESILLEKKGKTFRQEWRCTWQENEFCVRRDGRAYVVEAVRKPDPEIDIARYSPSTKTRRGMLQMLDYNVQRLELTDRRGLEILVITAICHCIDQEYDEKHKEGGSIYNDRTADMHRSGADVKSAAQTLPAYGRVNPQKNGMPEPNEIVVDLHVSNDAYIDHALRLLRQDKAGEGLHMIIIRADRPETTPRAVQIAAEVKARWYKLPAIVKGRTMDPMPGSTSETAEELYQYVRDPVMTQKQQQTASSAVSHDPTVGPRGRIKLDSPLSSSANSTGRDKKKDSPGISARSNGRHSGSSNSNAAFSSPPSQLAIYLSKDRIDEFERPNKV